MGCQFSAICKVVAQPVEKHLFPVNAVRRLRRRFRRNSATLAQRGSCSVRLCDKNGPFVTSGLVAVVEYQGAGHDLGGTARRRDEIKRIALERAGVRFVEINHGTDAGEIQRTIRELLARQPAK